MGQAHLRVGDLTIAGLATTLALYRDGRAAEVPTVAMLAATEAALAPIIAAVQDAAGLL